MNPDKHFDAIVIGGGPAGLKAGIYFSRARMKTPTVNEGTAGGQMILTNEIANSPGVENTSGYHLSSIKEKQAKKSGSDIRSEVSVKTLDLAGKIKRASLSDGSAYTLYTIILSTGGEGRELSIYPGKTP